MSTYAFIGSGSFQLTKHLVPIKPIDDALSGNVILTDTTNAVNIAMDVRLFNYKLGVVKQSNNVDISNNTASNIYLSYKDKINGFASKGDGTISNDDDADGRYNWANDTSSNSIVITAADMSANIVSSEQFGSIGNFETIYNAFQTKVHNYFGWCGGGFASLFSNSSDYAITADGDISGNGCLTKAGMYNMMKTTTVTPQPSNANYILSMNGQIELKNVSEMLRTALIQNTFGNRPFGLGQKCSHPSVGFGIGDGFVHGDKIYIPEGLQTTVNLKIQNTVGGVAITSSNTWTDLTALATNVKSTFTADSTLITNVVRAPVLITLVDVEATAPQCTNSSKIPLSGWEGRGNQIPKYSSL